MAETLTAVLVGCGGISQAWLKAAKGLPGLEITGLVDLIEANALKRQAEYGLGQAIVGTNLDQVLNAVRPDMVFDCTVPEAHCATTLTGLARGCHVLGEKPMADSMDNARRMAAAAQAAGKIYAVIQNRRYDPQIRRVRQFIDGGSLGSLTTLNCDFYLGAHFGGFRDAMQHVLLLDMAIHTFDAARLISGADPLSVTCKEWNPAGSWYAHGASAIAIFEMGDTKSGGGVVFTYRGSWCSEGLNTTWESDWRVIGQRGSLKWDGGANLTAQVVKKSGGFISEMETIEIPPLGPVSRTGGHAGVLTDFVDCVRTGRQPETICSDNIKSLAMVHSAIASAESGRTVAVEF
jgi:predicted dehydrogenase